MRSFIITAITFTLIFSTLAATDNAADAADWNQWRGPMRDGVDHDSPRLSLLKPNAAIKPIWKSENLASGREGGWGSPVVADGKAYLFIHGRTKLKALGKAKFPWLPPDKRGHLTPKQYQDYEKNRRDEDETRGQAYAFSETLVCISVATGKTLWKKQQKSIYTRFVQSGTPLIANGKCYVQGAGRVARCYNANTGDTIWETKLPGDFRDEFTMSSFAMADGVVATLCGHLFALDAKSGKVLWQGDKRKTSGSHASPIVWNDAGKSYFIVNVAGSETACFESGTGKEQWRVRTDANNATPVITARGQTSHMITYAKSRRGGLQCHKITPTGTEKVWTYHGLADKGSSPVVVGDYVYAQGERRLACVDLKSGEEKWATLINRRSPEYTSLVAADGKILYALESNLWFHADPSKYTPIMDGKLDGEGVMASQETHDARKAEKVGKIRPLRGPSPALFGGKLIIRVSEGLICYDLAGKAVAK